MDLFTLSGGSFYFGERVKRCLPPHPNNKSVFFRQAFTSPLVIYTRSLLDWRQLYDYGGRPGTQAEIPIGIITALLGAPLFAPLSFHCQPGDIWAVLGANGLGKSTLLDTLTGVLPPLSGTFSIEGGIGIVPQSFHPAFAWSVHEVVLMGRARPLWRKNIPSKLCGF